MSVGSAVVWASTAAVVALLLWLAFAFNRLVRLRNLVTEAWSGIDVQLKRRRDLVPPLVETVKGYRDFERNVLEDVTRTRSDADGSRTRTGLRDQENALTDRLRSLFILVEDYPDLRADRSFQTLQKQLTEIEDQLQYARRYYNGSVRDHNIAVESFPSNLVASAFNFRQAEFFEIETATDRMNPEVELHR